MDTIVENKLRVIYDTVGPAVKILDIFVQQFGEPYVDSTIKTYNEFIDILGTKTLESMGITKLSDTNIYGRYNISQEDYDNGKGKPLLEYVPDLGLLDFLTPYFQKIILGENTAFPIIIHFPNVRVSNESNKYVDIQDLYARVVIDINGLLLEKFKLNRTTFPYSHFKAGYVHSHMPRIDISDIGCWDYPCLGSGPIKRTQNTLITTYDLDRWGLFAFELSKYVTIESVNGGPYIRLEQIGRGDIIEGLQNLSYRDYVSRASYNATIDRFIAFCAAHDKFKIKFTNNQYLSGENCVSFIVNISNAFIAWINYNNRCKASVPTIGELFNCNVIRHYIVANNCIYGVDNSSTRNIDAAQRLNGRFLFTFKGKPVNLKILIDTNDTHINTTTLLTKEYCEYIITSILKLINYKYGKKKGQSQRATSTIQGATQVTAQADLGEKCYII